MMIRLPLLILVLTISTTVRNKMARAENEYTLDSVRQALIRQEDTIVFGLTERTKFPLNFLTYDKNYLQSPGFCGSIIEFLVQHTEAVQAQVNNNYNLFYLIYLIF